MTRRLLLVLALLAFAAPQLIPQTPQQTPGPAAQATGFGTIQGTIVRAGTAEPIPDVQVTAGGRGGMTLQNAQAIVNAVARGGGAGLPPELLQSAQEVARGGQALTAVTDSGGKFSIRNVPAGVQNVTAQLEGYFGPLINGNSAPLVTAPVTVTANQTSDVQLSMLPGGTITGRILDPNGKPLSDSPVQVLRFGYQNGIRSLQVFDLKTSDDRGEYRLYRIPPGEYYIAVNPRQTGPLGARGNVSAGTQEIAVSTFYPNAVDPDLALPVKLRSGDELSGINIQVRTAAGVKVSGRATSTVPAGSLTRARGTIPAVPSLVLIPRDNNGLVDFNGGAGSVLANETDGTFEIQNVTPGSYDLLARFPIETLTGWGPQNSPGLATGPWAFGRTSIDVRGVNVDNVSVVVRKGFDLKGRVILDGKPTRANVRISVVPENSDNINDQQSSLVFNQIRQYQAPIAEDGTFTIPLLPEGRYRFQVILNGSTPARGRGAAAQAGAAAALPPPPQLPATAYLADIRQGGSSSVYDDGLVVGGEQLNPVDVIVNTNAGSLEGNVTGADQKPASGMMVVLIPQASRRQNAALYKTAQSDAQGHFTMTGLAPGQYTVYAWENVPFGAYQNAAFLSNYEGRGTVVTVQAGARVTANLKSIPNDTSQR